MDGKRHDYLAVDENGNVCREDIILLLAKNKKNKRPIKKYFLDKKADISRDLVNYRNLIKNEAKEILDGSTYLFDS